MMQMQFYLSATTGLPRNRSASHNRGALTWRNAINPLYVTPAISRFGTSVVPLRHFCPVRPYRGAESLPAAYRENLNAQFLLSLAFRRRSFDRARGIFTLTSLLRREKIDFEIGERVNLANYEIISVTGEIISIFRDNIFYLAALISIQHRIHIESLEYDIFVPRYCAERINDRRLIVAVLRPRREFQL